MFNVTLAHVIEPGFAKVSGSRLVIRSQVGQGATASVWSWRAERAVEDAPAPAPLRSAPARIIVADDDELVRLVLADELRDHGYRVETCDGAAAVLALLDAGAAVDLLLTDLNMPGLNGFALIRAARERRPHLLAVLLTGCVDEATEPLPPRVTLLHKPVRGCILARTVMELLDGAGQVPPEASQQ